VAAVLGVREEPGRELAPTLTEHLKTRQLLLILDNVEHVLDAGAELATALLRQCPQVSLLVTSREILRITGEQTYRVPSLAVPDPKDDAVPETPRAIRGGPPVRRASANSAPGVRGDRGKRPSNRNICRRLDGIPLALELAAARVRSLAVTEIDRRLDERFRLLTGGTRAALPRQQTLRALIDWSYDLLATKEQALLCRLGIFAGGWSLAAAEQVCAGEGIEDGEVLDCWLRLSTEVWWWPKSTRARPDTAAGVSAPLRARPVARRTAGRFPGTRGTWPTFSLWWKRRNRT
jgi:non-specific serine/threonine protein kinase